MTIALTTATRVGGVVVAPATTATYDPAIEADLVSRGMATYVSRQGVTDTGVPVMAVSNPITGVIEISNIPIAPLVVIADGGSGATSGWIQASANPERFALELTIATGGAAASLTLDGSNDGQTSAAQIATASLDTTGVQTITAPIKPLYPWIRWTVVFAGSGNVKIARGA